MELCLRPWAPSAPGGGSRTNRRALLRRRGPGRPASRAAVRGSVATLPCQTAASPRSLVSLNALPRAACGGSVSSVASVSSGPTRAPRALCRPTSGSGTFA
eukprot:10379506-Alexandrium_andersonii.AAC.1